MVAKVSTVAFQGIEAVPVDVQVQISSGLVAFTIVGLPLLPLLKTLRELGAIDG